MPALCNPAKKVDSNKARVFGTPHRPPAFTWSMLEKISAVQSPGFG
jgi:hypothetical protein